MPLVSSLTIKMSNSSIFDSVREEEGVTSLKVIAGLNLAKKGNFGLNSHRPFSGLSEGDKESHFFPPTAPRSIESAFLALSKTFEDRGVFNLSIEAPPIKSISISSSNERLDKESITFLASLQTSGPTPSPGKINNFFLDFT